MVGSYQGRCRCGRPFGRIAEADAIANVIAITKVKAVCSIFRRAAHIRAFPLPTAVLQRKQGNRVVVARMLTIIIPTLNSERALVATLAPLIQGAMSGLVREVIIADGGSNDATVQVADLAGCTVLGSTATLGTRLHAAALAARAPWLMFLRPGIVLDPSWLDETSRFIAETENGGAAVFRKLVSRRAAYPLALEALSLLGFSLLRHAHPDQGLVIAGQLYWAVGGHDAKSNDPESDLLARLGRRLVMLRSGAKR
jgi:hypothetical protein